MINTTQNYKDTILGYAREFKNEVVISFNGTSETYYNCDIDITETMCQDENEIAMGCAFTKALTLKIYEPLRTISYKNATIVIRSGLKVGNAYEYVPMGTFYSNELETSDGFRTLTIKAFDKLAFAQQIYEPRFEGEITDTKILNDICTQYGLTLATGTSALGLSFDSYVEATAFETLGYLAGLQGKNAVMTRANELEFRFYTSIDFPIPPSEQIQGGLSVKANDISISAITSGIEGEEITIGNGNAITFYNPYVTESQLQTIFNRINGFTYAPLEVKTFGNPALEVGDKLTTTDNNGNGYATLVSSVQITLSGGCRMVIKSCGASDSDAAKSYSFESPTAKKIRQTYTELQKLIVEATELINNTKGGIFLITDSDGDGVNDGFTIADNINLDEARNVIKANANGIGLGTQGINGTFTTAITGQGIIANSVLVGDAKLGGYVDIRDGKLILGKADDETKLVEQNNRISFMNGETEVAFFNTDSLEFASGDKIKLGNFKIMRRANGNLTITI